MAAIQLLHNPQVHMIDKHSENGVVQENSLSLINPAQQVTTLATIANEEYPLSIVRARREQGDEPLVKYIMDKINDYLDMVDLRSSMNPRQVLLASQLIVEKHPHLPIKALDVFFKDAVCGEFGHHYNRMDIPTLMSWLQKFENDYFNMVEEQAYVEHQSTKGDNANFVDIYEKHKAECSEDKPVPMPDSFAKKHLRSEQQKVREKIKYKLMEKHYHTIRESLKLQGYEGIELFNETDKLLEQMVTTELKNKQL
jgi:hypothetical protein